MIEEFRITKIKENAREIVDDPVAVEVPLTLIIDEKELATFLCTPADLEDLVTGFLFTSGLIKGAPDIGKITIDGQRWTAHIDLRGGKMNGDLIFKRIYTSGCGRGILFYDAADLIGRSKVVSDMKIEAAEINTLMAGFQKMSETYLKTGGVHSAALAGKNGIFVFREDIGRHNAIDKVIGHALKEAVSFKDKIIITSGRISSEVIFKIQKCGIPVAISRSGPTNQAVKLSRDMGITLVGFARGGRMNVYSVEERII